MPVTVPIARTGRVAEMAGGGSLAGMGAAYWVPGKQEKGPPTERAREYLGTGVSNNVAEYNGLVESMTRATRRPH